MNAGIGSIHIRSQSSFLGLAFKTKLTLFSDTIDKGIHHPDAVGRLKKLLSIQITKSSVEQKKMKLIAPLVCADINSLGCASIINIAISMIQPAMIDPADFEEKIYAPESLFVFPYSMYRLFTYDLYSKIMSRLIERMIQEIESSPSKSLSLDQDLKLAIQEIVPQATQKNKDLFFQDIITIYSSGVISLDYKYPYFASEHYGLIAKIGIMNSLINILDLQKIKNEKKLYSLPDNMSQTGCFIGKPYHFWFGYIMTKLINRFTDLAPSVDVTHMLGLSHEFLGLTHQRKGILATKKPFSVHNQSIKLNIMLNDLGALFAVQEQINHVENVDFNQTYFDYSSKTQTLEADVENLNCNKLECMEPKKIYDTYSNWKKAIQPHYLIESKMFEDLL